MKILWKIKQKFLKYKYNNAKEIYIICLWAKWGVLPAKFYKIDKNGEPLTIQWTDHNGMCEEYYIAPWYNESTGAKFYNFNKQQAEFLVTAMRSIYF